MTWHSRDVDPASLWSRGRGEEIWKVVGIWESPAVILERIDKDGAGQRLTLGIQSHDFGKFYRLKKFFSDGSRDV